MEFKDRLQYLLDNKEINGKRVTSYAIGKNTSVSKASVIQYLNGTKPSIEKAKVLADYFEVSLEWLLQGSEPIPTNARHIESLGFMNVPLVHVKAKCGYLSGMGDAEYIEALPTMPVIVDKAYHGTYRLFEADGDSMDDGSRSSICDKDIVLAREVGRELWRSKLHIDNWYFVIVHRLEGIAIKKITHHDVERGVIVCHSLNPLFPDYAVPLDDVLELFNVIKIVDRSVRL